MTKTLHFQLVSGYTNENLTLHVGTSQHVLQVHTEETLQQAAVNNQALALLSEESRKHFTHFVNVSDEHFPTDRLRRIRVTSPDKDPTIYLPALHHVSIHIPEHHNRKYFERMHAKNGRFHHPKLESMGVTSLHNSMNDAELIQASVDAEYLQTPWDIAVAILFSNPELASNQPYTASIVKNSHIAPSSSVNPTQYNQVYNLATVISSQGMASSTGGWATITDSVDQFGNPLYYDYDFGTHKKGDRILIYKWSDLTTQNATAPNAGAMRTSSNDMTLQNQTWSVNQGKTANQQQDGTSSVTFRKLFAAPKLAADASEPTFKWTVKELTPNHGLSIYADSLAFKDNNTFSIDVKNTYLRTLTAYAEFFNENGDPIQNPEGWNEQLPSTISGWFETDYKKFISSLSAVNTIMGIPMPTDPTTLSFTFPNDATSLRLLFGGLGTSKWDEDVDLSGALLTGFFQYGIPSLFLAAGAAITSTKWFSDFVKDIDNVVAVLGASFGVVGGGVATAAALGNTKAVLSKFADAVAGILLGPGLEKLVLYITGQITVAELEDSIPFVGWALRAANMAMDFAEMAVTTGEVLSSPATLTSTVTRAMDLQFTLSPDPEHGEAGHPETAVWPGVADHYQVTVQYQGGTNFVLKGSMPEVTSNTPLQLTFANIPVGGSLQIIAGIYSTSGWLCGKYQGDWLPAFPDDGSTSLRQSGNITEILVPLTQDTQYNYKEKIIFDADSQKHIWHAGDVPTATVASLDCSSGGNHLCKPVGMSLNGQAYQVGYVWSASSQNYLAQNLSVLADPQSRFKLSEVSFAIQPAIAYDQFGLEPEDGQEQEISLNNFIVDTRNNEFHLRQVNLEDEQSGFGLNDPDLKSWGKFNLSTLDAIVVHPTGAVIAVSWEDSKMEILQIPAEPTDDAQAPDAQMVSGLGVRQGLMQGPRALAVTPDGRILILETLNQRIQSFDVQGNPVASFLGEKLFTLTAADYAPDLNQGIFSPALQQQFQENGLTHIFDLDVSLITDLNSGVLTSNLINAFANEGVYLSYDSENMDDHTLSSYVTVVTHDQEWTISDPTRSAVYNIQKANSSLNVCDVLTNVTIDVRAQGSIWVVEDWNGAQSYYIAQDEVNSQVLNVNRYLSYISLYNPEGRTDITYLDVSAEAKGYVYVLSYVEGGGVPGNYMMDIYDPNGMFLVRTPDSRLQPESPQYICAAKFVIDIWRNVYTLNYEAIVGANNRIEPSISHWIPTLPLFDLGLDKQPDFDNQDVAAVQADFAANGITLSSSTQIVTVSTSGYWQVIDGAQTYDVIRSGSSLEVYGIPVV
ncbi:hypothetical protein MH117_17860 [Paenibacillus sp. ACRRX]|uniref:hypothetical protein n=1 Tax=Paenibacillus sp. ACRRX TaxID=2918206 RepID=UPI001EF71457|nr:hypothetical protein [Paenibacillus sp. ACRRX]MCG7409287.1 hypothetical protein [Paenibacillus sp. ACRRX]